MNMVGKTLGVSILVFMISTYIFSFHLGWSYWYEDFIRFLRFINLPDVGWVWLDINFYNGRL